MRPVFSLFLAAAACLFSHLPARSAEVIRDYRAEIRLEADGWLDVTETITVNAEGDQIKRGIFRDFPLYAENAAGRRIEVDFELLSVDRDGRPEPHHTESVSGGIRIYAGSADVFVARGQHTYVLRYRTARQIRYFEDHDELYWNVTGNGWLFPIQRASATVHLPNGAAPTDTAAFTGAYGDTARNARIGRNGDAIVFETTRSLAQGEGLTVVVGIPKGIMAAPSSEQTFWWYLRDNAGSMIGVGGLVAVFLFYLRAWLRVGRDPDAGVMVPRWDPPDGISPALVNYIDNRGFSAGGWTALSASALDLAVKGYVVLDDLKNSIVIRRTDKVAASDLPSGQANLLAAVGGPGGELVIDKANGVRVQDVGRRFREAIEKEHRGRYYQANRGYIIAGLALSVAILVALVVFSGAVDETVPLMISMGFAAAIFGALAVRVGSRFRRGASLVSRISGIIGVAILGFMAFSTIGSFALVAITDVSHDQLPMAIGASGIILLNALFFFLMGAPTPLGRKLMDGIEGLRTYMTLAEKDRMNMQGAPQMSPSHFEKLLPYAVALGVEKPWTRTFETWLASAAAGAAAASYQPAWYGGGSPGHFSDRIGGFSSSMASTIASTIPAPKTSSSGFSSGGGFSGGGGGGGGGGGW